MEESFLRLKYPLDPDSDVEVQIPLYFVGFSLF